MAGSIVCRLRRAQRRAQNRDDGGYQIAKRKDKEEHVSIAVSNKHESLKLCNAVAPYGIRGPACYDRVSSFPPKAE